MVKLVGCLRRKPVMGAEAFSLVAFSWWQKYCCRGSSRNPHPILHTPQFAGDAGLSTH